MKLLRIGAAAVVVGVALASAVLGMVRPASAADMIGNCEMTGQKGAFAFTPAVAGQLTVEVSLPSPGWWNGDTPESIKDGYEYCMAANIAYRGGLDKVAVVNVSWDGLVAGQTRAFDLALSEISITDERKKVVDFSISYFGSDIGVLVKTGKEVQGADMKNLRIGVQQATTAADFVANTLKPVAPVKVYPETPGLFAALDADQIDAALIDTSIVLYRASTSNGTMQVVGQYSTGEEYGALYPKGSPNAAVLDKIIQSMIDDGTLKKLAEKYLAAA